MIGYVYVSPRLNARSILKLLLEIVVEVFRKHQYDY